MNGLRGRYVTMKKWKHLGMCMVVDVCENEVGEKAFLLAQGYMPAQSFHILNNPASDADPWYYTKDMVYPLVTPEYRFQEDQLKRLSY